MSCNVTLPDDYDKITGENNYCQSHHKTLNANNDCEYFKKRWFSPKQDKKLCCNCDHWWPW